MVLLEVLVEDGGSISYVLALHNYVSKKHSASAELATSCRKQNKIDYILWKYFFFFPLPRSFRVSGSMS